jgi:hypothetical protein
MVSSMKCNARSRNRSTALLALILGLAGTACTAAPAPSFVLRAATAGAGCTQEDLPALIVTLNGGRSGEIRIEIAGMPHAFTGERRVQLSPLRRDSAKGTSELARAELRSEGRTATWLSGTVTLRSVKPGQGVRGFYRFKGPERRTYSGSFEARWSGSEGGCG